MDSKVIHVRLSAAEVDMLAKISSSRSDGDRNTSEVVRLLIRREYGRRTNGRSVVSWNEVASDVRTGRPASQGKLFPGRKL